MTGGVGAAACASTPLTGSKVEAPHDVATACRLVGAMIDDCPDSTDLLLAAAGDVRTTLRLASMVAGLLEGDTPAEKHASLTTMSLVLQMQGVR